MGIELLERLLWVILFLSGFNIIRHAYYFIQAWVTSETDAPKKYFLTFRSLLLLGLSIGYVIMTIIKGINF